MGNTLGRYVLREVVTAWLVVTGVLLVILLANQVVGVLERAAANQYPQGVVLELIGSRMAARSVVDLIEAVDVLDMNCRPHRRV